MDAPEGHIAFELVMAPGAGRTGGVVDRAWLERQARTALGSIARRTGAAGEVRVRIVGDAEMAELHEQRSGVAGTTDVLTFDLRDTAAGAERLDVDIVVCVSEAARQAAQRGHATERELLLYIVHGVLHAVGHDDHDERGYARTHALEDEILREIGVGETFGEG